MSKFASVGFSKSGGLSKEKVKVSGLKENKFASAPPEMEYSISIPSGSDKDSANGCVPRFPSAREMVSPWVTSDGKIKALQKLKKSLNLNFNKAVDAIVNCQSKVILCGVGKSGIIASKISATLSSIGTPSFSLSANDCSHGDMGSMTRKDVLILISYLGNSIEL